MVQNVCWGHWPRVLGAVQFVSELEICQDAGFILRAGERVRVKQRIESRIKSSSRSKNRDNLSRFGGKQLTHIVRVSDSIIFHILPGLKILHYLLVQVPSYLG